MPAPGNARPNKNHRGVLYKKGHGMNSRALLILTSVSLLLRTDDWAIPNHEVTRRRRTGVRQSICSGGRCLRVNRVGTCFAIALWYDDRGNRDRDVPGGVGDFNHDQVYPAIPTADALSTQTQCTDVDVGGIGREVAVAGIGFIILVAED